MEGDVLAQILAEPDETSAAPVSASAPEPVHEASTKTKSAPATDPDLVWSDDDDDTSDSADDDAAPDEDADADGVPDKAPDQVQDQELDEIEARHKWMRGRLAPVKSKLEATEAENARLRTELEAARSGKPAAAPDTQSEPIAAPKSLDEYVSKHPDVVALESQLKELESKAESMTMGEYTDARLDILADLKLAKRDIKQAVVASQQQTQRAVAEAETKVLNDFTGAVLAKKDEIPGIETAFKRLEKNAGLLNTEIRRAIIFDGDKINPVAAELVHVLGTDKQAMSYLIAQSKAAARNGAVPTAAIEYIGRLKAKVAVEAAPDQEDEAPDTPVSVPRRRPGLPREIRHAANESGGPKDLGAWAADAVKAGKQPW